jgi:hypothetical protein
VCAFQKNCKKGDKFYVATMASTLVKRVNFILSDRAHSELVILSKETNRSMTELVRLGLGLVKIALEAARDGNRIVVTTQDGHPVKEIVIPS